MTRRLCTTIALVSVGALSFGGPGGMSRQRTPAGEPTAKTPARHLELVPDSQIPTDGELLANRVRASRDAKRSTPHTLPPAAFPRVASHAKAAPKPPRPTGAGRPAQQSTAGSAGPSRRVGVTPGRAGLNWSALEDCESSGNPRAVSPSGKYRGLHQFDLQTWRSVGGVGDPIDASPAEQRKRAWLLYLQRGRAPWPQCGRLL